MSSATERWRHWILGISNADLSAGLVVVDATASCLGSGRHHEAFWAPHESAIGTAILSA